MTPTYVIRPLVWEEDHTDGYHAPTIFGAIYVRRDFDGWAYTWCFDEIYDEGKVRCDNRDEAFAEAESFYLGRLSPAIEPVDPNVIWTCGECGKENRWKWDHHDASGWRPDRMECEHCGKSTENFMLTKFGNTA